MVKALENTIENYFQKSDQLSRVELLKAITIDFPDLTESTIKVYLSKLKKSGMINNPARGIYTISNKQSFTPEINQNLKKVYAKIQKEFPFINFCVWNTKWLNDFMRHQPFKNYTILEIDNDAVEQVFNTINENTKNLYLNPDEAMFERYINTNTDEVTIIKNLVTESPILKTDKIQIPTLEKLLVDIIINKDLFAAQQGELDFIYQSAFHKYEVNESKMKRYAARRNRKLELEKMMSTSLAKKVFFAKG